MMWFEWCETWVLHTRCDREVLRQLGDEPGIRCDRRICSESKMASRGNKCYSRRTSRGWWSPRLQSSIIGRAWNGRLVLPSPGMGDRRRCRQNPVAEGLRMVRSCCVVIRRRYKDLIDQMGGERWARSSGNIEGLDFLVLGDT